MKDRWNITIQINEEDLTRAREEFPSLCPASDPTEWTEDDFVHALAALQHRDFTVLDAVPWAGGA